MKLFGISLLEDPEETEYFKQKEEKRRERIVLQCNAWEMNEDHRFWDMIEMPVGVFIPNPPAKDDVKLHSELMKKQECHIFYGKKYCYHLGEEEITDIQ